MTDFINENETREEKGGFKFDWKSAAIGAGAIGVAWVAVEVGKKVSGYHNKKAVQYVDEDNLNDIEKRVKEIREELKKKAEGNADKDKETKKEEEKAA